jgi:hypothetical protein
VNGPPRELVRFSASSLVEMLAAHDMGPAHITMCDTPMWYPPEERGEVGACAWREFAGQGLTGRGGDLRDSVLDWLPALSHGGVEYFGWASEGETVTAYLVVPMGPDAVLATRQGGEIHVIGVDGRAPVEALVDNLPFAYTPRAMSLNVSRKALAAGRGRDVLEVRRLVQQPACGLGEFYVRVYDGYGHPNTRREPLRYRDVGDERWMIRLDGDYLSVLPATPTLFREDLYGTRDLLLR